MLTAMGAKSRPKAPDNNMQARVIYDPDYEDPEFRQAYEEVEEIFATKRDMVLFETATKHKAKIRLSDLDVDIFYGLIERCAQLMRMLSFSAKSRQWAKALIDRTLSGEMEPWEAPDRNKSPSAELHRYLREMKSHHTKLDKRYRKYGSLEKKLRRSYEELISGYLHPAPDPVVELCKHLIPKLKGKYSLPVIKQLAGQVAGIVFPSQVDLGSFRDKTSAVIAADIRNREKRYDAKRKDSPTGIRHGALIVDD